MGRKRSFGSFGRFVTVIFTVAFAFMSLSIMNVPEPPPPPTPTPTPVMEYIPAPPPTKAPPPTPEPTPQFFEISLIGDNTLAANHYSKGAAGTYESVVGDNYAYPYALTKQFFENDDCTIANLECVLSEYNYPTPKAFSFRAPPEYVNILTEGGVDFVSLGNNHTLDYGETGYADTKAALDAAGIGYAGRDEWTVFETKSGLKIGVYAASFEETEHIKSGIRALKEAGAEFIIAALHWGTEGMYQANNSQKNQGHAAIDAGADFVMGTHPHTLQEIEEYNGKYIYYCIGNWSFGGNTNPRDKDTVIVKLTVMRDIDGSISLTDRRHIPCAISSPEYGNSYQPFPYEEGSEEWERTMSKLEGTYTGPNLTVGYSYAQEG